MLDRETFKAVIVKELKDHLPEKYKDCEIKLGNIYKTNMEVETITLLPSEDNDFDLSPNFQIDMLYEVYKNSGSLDKVLNDMARTIESTSQIKMDGNIMNNLDYVREHVTMQLINTESNRAMLAGVPHREINDCSVVYRVVLSDDERGMNTVRIDNKQLSCMRMTESQLFELAKENTKRLMPVEIKPLSSVITSMLPFSDELAEELPEGLFQPEEEVWVMSSKNGINGAVQMLYAENLQKIADIVKDDIYVLPSSVHEVLCMSKSRNGLDNIADMVYEVNMEQVALKDRLSNQVYLYDRDSRTLTMATNNPERSIFGETEMVAERSAEYDVQQEKTR